MMSGFDPRFEARPSGPLGDGWNVHVFWTAEKADVVTGFATQYEALNWIKSKSANWVADYIINNPEY
jgi:hypothetical protein